MSITIRCVVKTDKIVCYKYIVFNLYTLRMCVFVYFFGDDRFTVISIQFIRLYRLGMFVCFCFFVSVPTQCLMCSLIFCFLSVVHVFIVVSCITYTYGVLFALSRVFFALEYTLFERIKKIRAFYTFDRERFSRYFNIKYTSYLSFIVFFGRRICVIISTAFIFVVCLFFFLNYYLTHIIHI